MVASTLNLKHGWVWALSILLFFFNTVSPLPEGLTVVMMLTPLWLYLLYLEHKLQLVVISLLQLMLYLPFHILSGVSITNYAISEVVLVALVVFVMALYLLLNHSNINLDLIFRDIAILNFFLVLLSIPLIFTPLKDVVWYTTPMSTNIKSFPRLKIFTSEASHYSFLLAPVAIYFYSRALLFKTPGSWFTLMIISVPLALSLSFGVLSGLLISGALIFLIYIRQIFKIKAKFFTVLGTTSFILILGYLIYHWFPQNPLIIRLRNIYHGNDTSTRGRIWESFILANKIAGLKSYIWGVGPGQLKLLGRNIIVQYYSYYKIPAIVRIPNACAETIAYFGYSGFIIRMAIEWWLFIKTRVYLHPYRLWLFLFLFIYQFTGSYITNPSEYICWVLAFSNVFPDFRKFNKVKKSDQ